MAEKEHKIVEHLQKFGLTSEEALVYFTLVKSGPKGAIVKDIDETLSIERTTIYSILKRLITKGCVFSSGKSKRGKHAKLFVARNPSEYLPEVIGQKEHELEEMKEIWEKHNDVLVRFYQKTVTFSREDLDPYILQFVDPLLDQGWRITSYDVKQRASQFDYYSTIYHLFLDAPQAVFYPESGLLLFVFDDNIEEDPVSLKFFLQNLKKQTRDEVLNAQVFTEAGGIEYVEILDLDVTDNTYKIHENSFPGFRYTFTLELDNKVTLSDLRKSPFFRAVENEEVLPDGKIKVDFGKSVVIAQGKDVFYYWTESMDLLLEMVDAMQGVKEKKN